MRPPVGERIGAGPTDRVGGRGGGNAGGNNRDGGGSLTGGIGTSLVLVLLIAGLAVAGWFLVNQQQQLAARTAELAAADKRLVRLESRLSMTDQMMSESGVDVNEQISFWESEIRKLWAISNERNKKWINENQQALAQASKQLTGHTGVLDGVKASLKKHEEALSQQKDIIDQLGSVDRQIRQLLDQQRDTTDKVNATNQVAQGLKRDLTGRVTELEQAISAIDAHRVQLNRRIATLESSDPGGGT